MANAGAVLSTDPPSANLNAIDPAAPVALLVTVSGGDILGGEAISGFSMGLAEGGFGSARAVRSDPSGPSGLETPVICPQLAFQPLVSGCQALLGPIGGGALAQTGASILLGLFGLLAVCAGFLVYRR